MVALATATLLGITAINVLTSNQGGSLPTSSNEGGGLPQNSALNQFLVAMPYSLFPVGLAGLALAMVASTKRPSLLGFSAGYLLFELLLLIVIGGVVTLVRARVNPKIVWPVTAGIILAVVISWALLCAVSKVCLYISRLVALVSIIIESLS